MSLATYATARSVIADALTLAVGDEWMVSDHPPDQLTHRTIALAPQVSQRVNRGRWRRDLTVGLFVARSPVATALSVLDAVLPTVVETLYGVDGVTVGPVTEPRPLTIADVDYLAQFIPIVIETTP